MMLKRFFRLMAISFTLLSFEVHAADLESVPFTPLPVGTVLDYGSWKCEITKSDSLLHRCEHGVDALDYLGKFFAVGVIRSQKYGNAVQQFQCDNTEYGSITHVQIKAASVAAALWPLTAGVKSTIIAEIKGDVPQQVEIKVKVGVPVVKAVLNREMKVYPISYDTTFENCPPDTGRNGGSGTETTYRTEILYAPQIGAIVQSKMKWLDGGDIGISRSYRLRSIDGERR
jgi:hypothetical protein